MTHWEKPHRNAADVLAVDVLDAFAGGGMVRVLERRSDAVILERLQPGTPLSALVANGEDDRATRILAHTIRQLRAERIPRGIPAAADLGAAFDRYRESGDRELPTELVHEARRQYFDLCDTQQAVRLLHGDLHHDNVLFDERRGWIAIDPHGVAGEVEYELAAALRNPVEQPGMLTEAGVFERRVDVFVGELAVDADRVRRWAFAAAVLAAIWTIEDGVDPALRQRWIAFAGMIQPRA